MGNTCNNPIFNIVDNNTKLILVEPIRIGSTVRIVKKITIIKNLKITAI